MRVSSMMFPSAWIAPGEPLSSSVLAAPVFALASAAGKKGHAEGWECEDAFHGYRSSRRPLGYLAESVSYPFEAGLRGAGARERDDVEAAGRVHTLLGAGGGEIELGSWGQRRCFAGLRWLRCIPRGRRR